MSDLEADILFSLTQFPPFDALPEDALAALEGHVTRFVAKEGQTLVHEGEKLDGLFVIETGTVDIEAADSELIAHRGPGDVFGERGLLRLGRATLTARVKEEATILLLPKEQFHDLMDEVTPFAAWFQRAVPGRVAGSGDEAAGLTALHVSDLMTKTPVSCPVESTVTDVARTMRSNGISSVIVMAGEAPAGIVTVRDLTNKVLAEGLDGTTPVDRIMTPDPITIAPDALGLDALMTLADNNISHLPVAENGRIVGLIGRTDLFRQQAATASHMIVEIVDATSATEMAKVVTQVPGLLAQLVRSGAGPNAISRRITDITDAITRRLLALAEETLGPPPVPYLWLACGSQGRREQTGQSDQDNCLILDDSFKPEHDAYFAALAKFVSDGLNECGFVYCPGDMMATSPRWRQPRRVWREYFAGWIAQPDNEAQMLASVMFDLRPIGGTTALFADLQAETLAMARKNSIFVAHMVSNSLKHTPPLGLLRGFALIRSGEHKDTVDLKLSGVVPVVDLGRVYALKGAIETANTHDRIEAARAAGVISQTGAHDLLDAYDFIAETRLRHQADQIAAGGKPDNFMAPSSLSELERNHLRDAFMVIKTMQSSVGRGSGVMG
ncbi:putative signal-transduction protein containing cAMP-binding and CBS domain [Rhodovulum sp. P5]|uniref:DUF294 nucleotidyltransferase-like domain-containing protein n=1 Tax=Rhodovulum sp. P5 TaxID=1564506 RepID=UPI0009C28077|nr:DUF294 nucleotidyltransferase-like domain-containing protein [Rhodovulum sp. P5]ARE42113.1 putative signal-transduction protein containing cAMP-binding and CBS domain [Rhodovulum sp. P5]